MVLIAVDDGEYALYCALLVHYGTHDDSRLAQAIGAIAKIGGSTTYKSSCTRVRRIEESD
jgi:hypothetical protein